MKGIELNPSIYSRPLEEHVSRWYFSLEATDKEGASVSDKLEVVVQHHQQHRAVNHEITLMMEPTALLRQERVLHWEVVLVEALARLFGDNETSKITVRRLDLAQLSSNGSISLTFTNDSLPRNHCPHQGIQENLKVCLPFFDIALNLCGNNYTYNFCLFFFFCLLSRCFEEMKMETQV